MARTSAAERARRLIALLGRFTRTDEPIPLAELARDVGTTPEQLTADLELLSMCGVAPYSPDVLMPVFVDDGVVEVFGDLPAVRGGVRLSAREARALATALQVAGLSADDALVRRLMAAATGDVDPEAVARALRSTIAEHGAEVYGTLASACAERSVVRILYQRAGDVVQVERDIEPERLVIERGAWYVSGHCRLARGTRTFRLDRIKEAHRTGETFEQRVEPAGEQAFDATGLPLATLAFSPAEPFDERDWPGGTVVGCDEDGRVLATVPYAGTSWIARHVVARFGTVEALEPEEVREAVASLARSELEALRK